MKIIMIKNKYLPLGKSVAVPDDEAFEVGEPIVFADGNGLHLGEVERLSGKFDPTSDVVFERRATEADLDKARSNENKLRRARRYCGSLLLKHKLELKIVDVYANLDFGKAIFYFTANGRVDFRDLVKDLASELRTRIEMRQINEREEVSMCGGIGPCGQLCCCKRFLGKSGQVAIKMAKNQGIALNPNKINGYCGKLMCCLAYENDVYLDAMRAMPKVGSTVVLPTGEKGIVHFNKLLERIVTVDLIGDNAVMIDYPLAELQACNASFETIACGYDGACAGKSECGSAEMDADDDKGADECEKLNIDENINANMRASTYEKDNITNNDNKNKNLQKTKGNRNNNHKNDDSRKTKGAKTGFQKNERLTNKNRFGGENEQ